MTNKKKYIIANWKMNFNVHEASVYAHKLMAAVKGHRDVEVVIAPTMLALQSISLQLDHRTFKLASQNLYWRDEGAFTGEVSARHLRGVVSYAIIGHSERRYTFHEQPKDTGLKVQAAVRNRITPILCIGETAVEREAGETKMVLHDQLIAGLHNLTTEDMENVVIAYEPVWAISNGRDFGAHKTPTPHDIQEATEAIRSQLQDLFGKKTAQQVPVLYGGSVSHANAQSYLSVRGVDGLLVGGASLKLEQFTTIIEAAHSSARKERKA